VGCHHGTSPDRCRASRLPGRPHAKSRSPPYSPTSGTRRQQDWLLASRSLLVAGKLCKGLERPPAERHSFYCRRFARPHNRTRCSIPVAPVLQRGVLQRGIGLRCIARVPARVRCRCAAPGVRLIQYWPSSNTGFTISDAARRVAAWRVVLLVINLSRVAAHCPIRPGGSTH
jgi:hypothetical protein